MPPTAPTVHPLPAGQRRYTNAALAQVGAAELATVGALDDGIRAALHSTMAPLRGKLGVRAA